VPDPASEPTSTEEILVKALEEIKRVAAPGGLLRGLAVEALAKVSRAKGE
jgi:hypothetical protein